MNILYEVNLAVQQEVADEYADWLKGHIAEILKIDGFLGAEWLSDDETSGDGRVCWTVHYRLRSREAFDAYMRDHAPRLREDGMRRFGGKFSATRKVLSIRHTWEA
jgi:heme-degrading monooxygenase HmoA